MKKVLLTSAAVLAVFGAAAPVLAQGDGSNNPLTNKSYVSHRDIADAVNAYLAAHQADIQAEAEKQPTVVSAAATLKAAQDAVKNFDYTGHDYDTKVASLKQAVTDAQAAYDAALADAVQTVTNAYTKSMQENYENNPNFNRYEDPINDNNPEDVRKAEDRKNNGLAPVDNNGSTDNNKPADNNNGQADNNNGQADDKKVAPSQEQTDKAKAEAKKVAKAAAKTTAAKAAAKSGAKTLPNTAAVK